VKVTALAGGVGAGKFLRGLVRVVPGDRVTVIGNTGDDLVLHGLRISPDLDSVAYWLAGVADGQRGWGRAGETFRTLEELRRLEGEAWFGLGDLDLATHLFRTHRLTEGATLSEATTALCERLGVPCRLLPMSNDRVETWIHAVEDGRDIEETFQEYWVAHQARHEVKSVAYRGAEEARPAPGVLEALADADAVVLCPSNPVASLAPILAVPEIGRAVEARRDRVVGVSPIVGGAPLRGMAARLMPAAGLPVTAHGAAAAYRGLLGVWVIDERDAGLRDAIRADLGIPVAVTDTVMTDDEAAERLARFALELLG
jgi:LPPG:FO 2-phospho-L-lactate transferase